MAFPQHNSLTKIVILKTTLPYINHVLFTYNCHIDINVSVIAHLRHGYLCLSDHS